MLRIALASLLLATMAVVVCPFGPAQTANKKPNILVNTLVIFGDDVGYWEP